MKAQVAFNPFPGLRAFEPDEDHLFFGREKETDDLLARLAQRCFLAVIGSSGSGKSSLVRSGLIPALQSGFMVKAGSSWRVAAIRPGEDPIGNLAAALDAPDVLGAAHDLSETNRVMLQATLRRSTLGLVEAVRQARLPAGENLLVLVDQFEEIFRYRGTRHASKDETVMFVKLLLEATAHEAPIYVVLTMRSDFIGDCLEYPGLPEAVNAGQYLVPRMTRDELRTAITGPVAVAGGKISERLVLRLINHIGDDPDQLPVLQHALMRTWEYWEAHHQPGEPMDIAHYEAIGGMRRALSIHADEAFDEIDSQRGKEIAESIFRSLTDTFTDVRGVRRPTPIHELASVSGAAEAEVMSIVEVFRRPGRSFLTPPPYVFLTSDSIIDISHESLMRCWTRLIGWVEKERVSAASYARVAEAAEWYSEGTAGLWRDPQLELGLEWRRKNRPTEAWAHRYDPFFDRAMKFLDSSEQERDRIRAEQERERRRKLTRAWSFSAALGVLLLAALIAAVAASRANARAESSLRTTVDALNKMLLAAGAQSTRSVADSAETEEFRRSLLEKAQTIYSELSVQQPNSELVREQIAMAHFRLGDIQRLQQQTAAAIDEYQKAIVEYESLGKDFPDRAEYRQSLADVYNWLGETERPLPQYRMDAEQAYDSALRLQQVLTQQTPGNVTYQQELARTHYNRGILLADNGQTDDSDFREAIKILEGIANSPAAAPEIRQELARAYNNYARLLRRMNRGSDARAFYERAIEIHRALTQNEPANRELKLELAAFYNNLSVLFQEQNELDLANQSNSMAIATFENLSAPAPSVGVELAHAHDIRGRILESLSRRMEAEKEYERSISMFQAMEDSSVSSDFHFRYGQALFNLAAFERQDRNLSGAARLLVEATIQHSASGSRADLAYDYLLLIRTYLELGSTIEARSSAARLSGMLSDVPEPDRSTINDALEGLRGRLTPE